MPAEHSDPFTPSPPAPRDLGRLVTHRLIEGGWQCRCCPNLLTATAGGGVICLDCDIVRSTNR